MIDHNCDINCIAYFWELRVEFLSCYQQKCVLVCIKFKSTNVLINEFFSLKSNFPITCFTLFCFCLFFLHNKPNNSNCPIQLPTSTSTSLHKNQSTSMYIYAQKSILLLGILIKPQQSHQCDASIQMQFDDKSFQHHNRLSASIHFTFATNNTQLFECSSVFYVHVQLKLHSHLINFACKKGHQTKIVQYIAGLYVQCNCIKRAA